MKPKIKLLSLLLAVCLVAGLMPTAAFAAGTDTGKAIQLVDSGTAANISGWDSTNGYDYIYYGTWNDSAIKWRVLDDQTNTGENGLYLLSEELLGTGTNGGVYFQQSYHYDNLSDFHKGSAPADGDHTDCLIANAWQGSDAQTWCANFYSSNFSAGEQGAVLGTTKSDAAFTSSTISVPFAASENILNGDKVFFLSAQEAENSKYGFTNDAARVANYGGSAGVWWLRSPGAYGTGDPGTVYCDGYVDFSDIAGVWAARPAFNLDLTSVLFTSAAAGGKSASGMDSGLTAIGDYNGSEWKLTLLDSSRDFSISNATTNASGDTIAFSYSDAQTGENEYISVAIVDNGAITHYGRILQLDGTTNGTNGTASLMLPAGVTLSDTTKLCVFNEQYNGGKNDDTKLTDYASKLIEIANPTVDETAPTLTAGEVSRDSETDATVKFTSDEAGEYYYAVVESGADEPSIDTTGKGASCVEGENTISLTALTGNEAKDIYIVAKDAAGNVSDKLKIKIPVTPVYGISASPTGLEFDVVCPGYARPDKQTVTITNTGNQDLKLTQPASTDSFEVGTLSDTDLPVDGTVTFTVQPKAGLSEGTYDEEIIVSGSGNASLSVSACFTVKHDLKKTEAKEATCTEDGNIEYWYCDACGKYFTDENAENETTLAETVIPATGHSYENGKCTVCEAIDPDFKAVIIEGANGEWQKGTEDGLSFTSNAAFADFLKVQVDGKDLDASNYTVKEGSTIVTLKAEYLETLSVGTHTLAIVSETGTATTEFTIKAAADSSAQTGDDFNIALYAGLMILAAAGATAAGISRRKEQ